MPLPEIADYPAHFAYRFCPRCGGPLGRRTDDHRERLACPADGWTFYPTANQAATVVAEHDDGVVLLRRAIAPDAGTWHLPIGHLEYGEHPADGAVREAEEETGLKLAEPVFLDFEHSPSYGDVRMFYIVFCYRAKVVGGTLGVNEENSEVRLFPPDALPSLKWSSQRRAVAAWRAWGEGRPWVPGRRFEEIFPGERWHQ
jgi:ADP-ribose pyrophosphatase YjhB (NUDIX family)